MRDYAMIYRILCEDLRPFVRLRGPKGYAVRAQLRSFYKKLSPNGVIGVKAEAVALEKFLAINSQLPDDFAYAPENEQDRRFWRIFKRILYEATDWLWDEGAVNLTTEDLSQFIGVGPGSNIGANSDSFYTKLFDGPLTGTSSQTFARYRAALCETGAWLSAEKQRHERFGDTIVEGNRLFFVPKNVETARTCCTEPTANMIVQKMIGGFLEYRLKRFFGIDLSKQPAYNRALCRVGSSNGTFGTIDLSSASDSLSWSLVQQVCSPSLIGWIADCRATVTTLPGGGSITPRMVGTMGNGFTFPLETLIFAAVVRAVYHIKGYPCADPSRHFAVFGDDIIVRTECYDEVVRQLSKLCFKVNDAKSFNTGPFRESCGHDYYDGVFVRPVYIKTLETPSMVYSAFNRLARWATDVGVNLNRTLMHLKGLARLRVVPPFESDDAGFKVPHFVARELSTDTRIYSGLVVRPRVSGVAECPHSSDQLGFRDYNPDAWLVTALGGYTRTQGSGANRRTVLMLRTPPSARPLYRVAKSKSLWWDWPGRHTYSVSYDKWKYVVAAALLS